MTRIAFQGDHGSNSDEACREFFPSYERLPCVGFDEAFDAVKSGAASLGMIPIENSVAGRVADVYHLLPASGLRIVGERFKAIHFSLMANPGTRLEEVRTVTSHVMALAQCRKIIRKLGARAEVAADTAGAARALAERPDPARAALAPPLAADLYGLTVLAERVEDAPHNATRFLVMSREERPDLDAGEAWITAFVFRVRNIPAALFKVLSGFATNGVNMTKLESYMENGNFTATVFYAEVEGRRGDAGFDHAIEELAFFSDHFNVLGEFRADPFRRRKA